MSSPSVAGPTRLGLPPRKRMAARLIRTLETLNGKGEVLQLGTPIATVLYTITVRQALTRESDDYLQGPETIDGTLLVIDGQRNLVIGKELLLRLKDGCKAVFSARHGDGVSGTYQIDVHLLAPKS